IRHCGVIRVKPVPAGRVRLWLALRGSPAGRRLRPVIGTPSTVLFGGITGKKAVYHHAGSAIDRGFPEKSRRLRQSHKQEQGGSAKQVQLCSPASRPASGTGASSR